MNLPYKICLELRDAGFPQKQFPMICEHDRVNGVCDECTGRKTGWAYRPNLSVLLDSLDGAPFSDIILGKNDDSGHESRRWSAHINLPPIDGITDVNGSRFISSYGHTRDEAVAVLWMELRKRNEL